MPLVTIYCRPAYYPPDSRAQSLTPREQLTLTIASKLPAWVAVGLKTAGTIVETSEVRVGLGRIHVQTIHGPEDLQIVLMVGLGEAETLDAQRRRRAQVCGAIFTGLNELRCEMQPLALGVRWPHTALEVLLVPMTGFTTDPGGQVTGTWGNHPAIPFPPGV